ncbi:hypothetical protein LINPERHAP2_LOCUS23699 [Linum perenne]
MTSPSLSVSRTFALTLLRLTRANDDHNRRRWLNGLVLSITFPSSEDPTGKLFTIELHYGGVMIGDAYRYGHIAYMDLVDPDKLSLHELNKMVEYLGVYGGIFEYLWLFLGKNSQMG